MESLTEKIQRFLSLDFGSGSGSGYGSGYGSGDGDGSGSGSGSGSGYGYGDGYGSGSGSGSGSGDGDGYGYGYGSGSGDGDGDGYGDGDGIIQYNQFPVYYLDGVETLIYSVCRNVAHGAILNGDLMLSECVIVRNDRYFAHGKTLSEAMDALQEKVFDDIDEDGRVSAFLETFPDPDKPIPNEDLYEWHHRLTGSCKMGRDAFVKSHGIDMNGKTTVRAFCELVKDSYGMNVIQKVMEEYDA